MKVNPKAIEVEADLDSEIRQLRNYLQEETLLVNWSQELCKEGSLEHGVVINNLFYHERIDMVERFVRLIKDYTSLLDYLPVLWEVVCDNVEDAKLHNKHIEWESWFYTHYVTLEKLFNQAE